MPRQAKILLTLIFTNILRSGNAIIIHTAISDSVYRVDVTTAPFFVVLNAPAYCAGSIIAGSDPKYVSMLVFIFTWLKMWIGCGNAVSFMQALMQMHTSVHKAAHSPWHTHSLTHSLAVPHALQHSLTPPCAFTRSPLRTHSRTHSPSPTHSRTHALTHSRTHALTYSPWCTHSLPKISAYCYRGALPLQ